jgi:hypothetical protein
MGLKLLEREWDAETAGDLVERRWFALLSAINNLQSECAVLLDASKLADIAWRRACVQLAEFEALRDALEEEISARLPTPPVPQPQRLKCEARSGFRSAGRR